MGKILRPAVSIDCAPRSRLKRKTQIRRRLKSLLRILLEAALYNSFEPRRDTGQNLREGCRFLIQNRAHRIDRRRLLKGPLPCQHFVKNRAKRQYVRSLIRDLSRTCSGDMYPMEPMSIPAIGLHSCDDCASPTPWVALIVPARNPESWHGHLLSGTDFRLQIAMNDPLFMRRRKSLRNLRPVIDDLPNRQRTALQPVAQSLAFQQLRDQVRRTLIDPIW